MVETRVQESKLIQLTEVPENGKPIGKPKIIFAYDSSDIDWASLEKHIPAGSNAYLFSEKIRQDYTGFVLRAVQFYQIPEKG